MSNCRWRLAAYNTAVRLETGHLHTSYELDRFVSAAVIVVVVVAAVVVVVVAVTFVLSVLVSVATVLLFSS